MALGQRGRESRAIEHGERFVYGACTTHEPHSSKARARNSARVHQRRVDAGKQACARCRRGMIPEVWKCSYDFGHWHWGHSWRRAHQPSGGD